jgi:spore photoproduct lyase
MLHRSAWHRAFDRVAICRRLAFAGYRIGLTIAPIILAEGWESAYGALIGDVAKALDGAPDVDLTAELITHRFTANSKAVLESWYPGSALDMTTLNRSEKRTKFGSVKQVYDAETMKTLRTFFEAELKAQLPTARILYWT